MSMLGGEFDFVVTVCDHAHVAVPPFPGRSKIVHVLFDDPPRLPQNDKSAEEALGHYRRVRDQIRECREFVLGLPGNLEDDYRG